MSTCVYINMVLGKGRMVNLSLLNNISGLLRFGSEPLASLLNCSATGLGKLKPISIGLKTCLHCLL